MAFDAEKGSCGLDVLSARIVEAAKFDPEDDKFAIRAKAWLHEKFPDVLPAWPEKP